MFIEKKSMNKLQTDFIKHMWFFFLIIVPFIVHYLCIAHSVCAYACVCERFLLYSQIEFAEKNLCDKDSLLGRQNNDPHKDVRC